MRLEPQPLGRYLIFSDPEEWLECDFGAVCPIGTIRATLADGNPAALPPGHYLFDLVDAWTDQDGRLTVRVQNARPFQEHGQ